MVARLFERLLMDEIVAVQVALGDFPLGGRLNSDPDQE